MTEPGKRSTTRCVRKQIEKKSTPTVVIIDSQLNRIAEGGSEHGDDARKNITGRKRHLTVDTPRLVLTVVVHAANSRDQSEAKMVMEKINKQFCRLKVIFGDSAYGRRELSEWAKQSFA